MMKYLVGLLLIFFLAICQFSILPFNLVFLLVFLIILGAEEVGALIFVFCAGIVFDLTSASTLGTSSLAFLISAGIVLLYRRRFSFANPIVVFVFFLIFYFLSLQITGRRWNLLEVFFLSLLAQIAKIIAPSFFRNEKEKIKL